MDLVGARADRLVLATVKSFFGSRGVASEDVTGQTSNRDTRGLYRLLNEPDLRNAVIATAAKRFGYQTGQVRLRLYVGKSQARRKDTMRSGSGTGVRTRSRVAGRSKCSALRMSFQRYAQPLLSGSIATTQS